jgi:hypothetical protein
MRGGGINGDRQRKSKGMEEEEIKGHAMKADGVDDDDTIDALSEKWGDNPWNIRSGTRRQRPPWLMQTPMDRSMAEPTNAS